jgi:hypothetical protein
VAHTHTRSARGADIVQACRRRRVGAWFFCPTNLLVRALASTRLAIRGPLFPRRAGGHRRTAENSRQEWSPAETVHILPATTRRAMERRLARPSNRPRGVPQGQGEGRWEDSWLLELTDVTGVESDGRQLREGKCRSSSTCEYVTGRAQRSGRRGAKTGLLLLLFQSPRRPTAIERWRLARLPC